MEISFSKFQGTGNDFVIMDAWEQEINLSTDQIRHTCDRRFGIGADGLMIIRRHPECDFEMLYFNADGYPGSMCGNGGRCLVKYAYERGYIGRHTRFMAVDGEHRADILDQGDVSLQMGDVKGFEKRNDAFFLNTGSPHYVCFVENAKRTDVVAEGRKIRYNEEFAAAGTNVNFVQQLSGTSIFIRTYERGVEDETLSCGTGVTAAALVSMAGVPGKDRGTVQVETPGGSLQVDFVRKENGFTGIRLIGPATFVFKGTIRYDQGE